MIDGLVSLTRAGTRPLITLALAGGFIVAALSPLFGADVENATFATTALAGPMGICIGWWFKSRDEAHRQ